MAQEGVVYERSKKGRKRLTDITDYAPDSYSPLIFNTSNPNAKKVDAVSVDESQTVGKTINVKGVLQLNNEGHGFLRANGYYTDALNDVFVGKDAVISLKLKEGDFVEGVAVMVDGLPSIRRVNYVNGVEFTKVNRNSFDALQVGYATQKFNLSTSGDMALKVIDLLSPIGKGQRALIYAPEKAGKSRVLKKVINAISEDKNVKVFTLLVGRRPEEVYEYLDAKTSEVVNLDLNYNLAEQVGVAELLLNRCKRLVEMGNDVVLAIDDIIGLVKTYNYLSSKRSFLASEHMLFGMV